MKICVAQTRPFKGDISRNIDVHKELICLAAEDGVELIIFPELSITGYEPELAEKLATNKDDSRFDDLQNLSDKHQIITGAGMPLITDAGVNIGMIIFQPGRPREIYTKKYLHEDEYPYFVSGNDQPVLQTQAGKIALAICYELSVEQHAADAFSKGAEIYVASVAKTKEGMDKALTRLREIASDYNMTVLVANSTGPSDNFTGDGRSSVLNRNGELSGQLNESEEGLLIWDTITEKVTHKQYRYEQ